MAFGVDTFFIEIKTNKRELSVPYYLSHALSRLLSTVSFAYFLSWSHYFWPMFQMRANE